MIDLVQWRASIGAFNIVYQSNKSTTTIVSQDYHCVCAVIGNIIYLICTNLNKARNSKSTCISKITHLDRTF